MATRDASRSNGRRLTWCAQGFVQHLPSQRFQATKGRRSDARKSRHRQEVRLDKLSASPFGRENRWRIVMLRCIFVRQYWKTSQVIIKIVAYHSIGARVSDETHPESGQSLVIFPGACSDANSRIPDPTKSPASLAGISTRTAQANLTCCR